MSGEEDSLNTILNTYIKLGLCEKFEVHTPLCTPVHALFSVHGCAQILVNIEARELIF